MLRKIIRKYRSIVSGVEKKHIPIVRLEGIIGGKGYGKKGLTLDTIKSGLNDAFKFDKKSKEVILIINSPGGSPSQSSLIFKYITHLKEKENKDVLVFVEDVAASGGYYIACAGNSIFADDHSITGSIGVVSGGFGFVDAIKKLGVERRVHTSGENKSMLDPFSPEQEEDIAHLKSIQSEIHSVFKDVVLKARGDKLITPQENEIFTGKFWAANKAKELGLIDDITTLEEVLTERYGEDYRLFNIEMDKRSFFEKKFGMFASELVCTLTATIENKLSHSSLNKFLLK